MSGIYAKRRAEQILRECPIELRQNIIEWINKKTLSDIYIGELSVNKILRFWNARIEVSHAIIGMAVYKENGCMYPDIILRESKLW